MGLRLYVLALCVACLSLSGCSRGFLVVVEGGVEEGVSFSFYAKGESQEKASFNVQEIVVQEEVSLNVWRDIWCLTGAAEIDSVRYGKRHVGLNEVTSPQKLNVNSKYRVVILERPEHGGSGYGASMFRTTESGKVVMIDSVDFSQ